MHNTDFEAVRRYVTGRGDGVKLGSIFAGILFLGGIICTSPPLCLVGGLVLAVVILAAGSSSTKSYKQSLDDLHSGSSESEAARDFAISKEIPGAGRIGNAYFFGKGTGVIVRFSEVASIVQRVHFSSEDHEPDVSLQFIRHDGGRRLLIPLFLAKKQYLKAGATLALLEDKCPLNADAQELLAQYKSIPAEERS